MSTALQNARIVFYPPEICWYYCVSVVLMDGRVREGQILPGYVGDNQNAIRNAMVDDEKT